MTSALSWLGVGAAVCGVGSIVKATVIVLVVTPSAAVTAMVVSPGRLAAAVTTALAPASVVAAVTVGTTDVPAWQYYRVASRQ